MFPAIQPDDLPEHLQLRCQRVPAGTQVKGWVCGPIVMAVVHWNKVASKPCLDVMSGGKLLCYCAKEPVPTRKIGYVPLLTVRRERIVVIVSNGVAKKLIPLGHGAPIELHRTLVPCAPLFYKEWASHECGAENTKRMKSYHPVDIQPWLLHLWNSEVLRKYYTDVHSASVPAPTVVEVPQEDNSALGADTTPSDNPVSLSGPNPKRLGRKNAG